MAQQFQKLVQEDLNIGTEAVWTTAPGGGDLRSTQVGIHSVARGQLAYEAAWTPGVISAGSYASTTVTVPDAATGDYVMASHDKMLTNALRISGHVSASNTVKVVIHNPTTASITVAAGTVKVAAFPARGVSAVVVATTVSGTVYLDTEAPGNEVFPALVSIVAQGLSVSANASGYYHFPSVTPGAVTVSATSPGLTGGSASGTAVSEQDTIINVVVTTPI
jgi:hypothetical protein